MIVIDRDLCVGSGVCISLAPSTFSHDDATKAIVLEDAGDPALDIQAAGEGCPTGAILLTYRGEG
jgi:ferredoxin